MKRLRVIGGEFRGRKLKSLPGRDVRPTADKIKGALFNMVGPFFEGGSGLDLFAGTGALGIEALSRGLERVVFVDRFRPAVRLIRANLNTLGLEGRAEVYHQDAQAALSRFGAEKRQFQIVFLDPPYVLGSAPLEWLHQVGEEHLLAPDAVVVLEHDSRVSVPEQVGTLTRAKQRRYGHTTLTIFHRT